MQRKFHDSDANISHNGTEEEIIVFRGTGGFKIQRVSLKSAWPPYMIFPARLAVLYNCRACKKAQNPVAVMKSEK